MGSLENNPVLAAFGTASTIDVPRHPHAPALAHHPIVLEWDLHVSPAAVAAYEAEAAAQVARGAPMSPDRRRHHARALALSAVIAHGSMWHTLSERMFGRSAYAAVRNISAGWPEDKPVDDKDGAEAVQGTSNDPHQPMHPPRWLHCYFNALREREPSVYARVQPAMPIAGASDSTSSSHGAATGSANPRPLVSVFLDVKSSSASGAALGLLIEGLNSLGVHVWALGSFVRRQVVPAEAYPTQQYVAVRRPPGEGEGKELAEGGPDGGSSAAAAVLPCPAPIRFYIVSMPGEIQRGVANGSLPPGADVLFNGSTLLLPDDAAAVPGADAGSAGSGGGGNGWRADTRVLDGLGALVASHGLRLGLYAQETLMDAGAVSALAEAVNEHPHVFYYGWSYANVPGQAAADIPRGSGWAVPWWLRPLVVVPWR